MYWQSSITLTPAAAAAAAVYCSSIVGGVDCAHVDAL